VTYARRPVERDEIEHQEFPPARRGYDAAAVHAHLRRVADEFEALAARPRSASLAEGASMQVRAILEAAEAGAQELRDQAGRDASAHVARARDAARQLIARLDELKAELDGLLGGVRSNVEALARTLDELGHDTAVLAPPAGSPEVAGAQPPAVPAPAVNGTPSENDAGARLVALNMALEGAPREQAAGYLAEHFDLADVDALLDAVYASVGR